MRWVAWWWRLACCYIWRCSSKILFIVVNHAANLLLFKKQVMEPEMKSSHIHLDDITTIITNTALIRDIPRISQQSVLVRETASKTAYSAV